MKTANDDRSRCSVVPAYGWSCDRTTRDRPIVSGQTTIHLLPATLARHNFSSGFRTPLPPAWFSTHRRDPAAPESCGCRSRHREDAWRTSDGMCGIRPFGDLNPRDGGAHSFLNPGVLDMMPPYHPAPVDQHPDQTFVMAAAIDWNTPRPSLLPSSASAQRSGCGIMPRTFRPLLQMPAMLRAEPFGFDWRVTRPSASQ